jgi:hypothetical protein
MLFESFISSLQIMVDSELTEVLSLAVGAFALLLLAITLSAYRKTNLLRLLLVSSAFGLFAVKTLVRHLDLFVFNWGPQTTDFLLTALDFVILVLFFLSLSVKKQR